MADSAKRRRFPSDIPGMLCEREFRSDSPTLEAQLDVFCKKIKAELERYGLAECVLARKEGEGTFTIAAFPASSTAGPITQQSNRSGAIDSGGLRDALTTAANSQGAPKAVDSPGLARGLAPSGGGFRVGPRRR